MSRRIVVHDYVGHPFQVQLSRELARRGHEVLHLYSASFQTPRGKLAKTAEDPPQFLVEPIHLDAPLVKGAFTKRWLQEAEYGRRLRLSVTRFRPDVVISANAPLEAQRALSALCRQEGYRFVYWVQDLYGVAALRILRRRLSILGELVGRYYVRLERRLIRASDHVVLISGDFAGALAGALPPPDRVSVIPNWAPIEEVPLHPKDNPWSRAMGLTQHELVVYAGTLGMKHNPAVLLELARHLAARDGARLAVISEGLGGQWLEEQARANDLCNFIRLDFQPFGRMPEVLASADVLLAILEAEAGVFSVPSKVLTYLAAGRPIVAAIPADNLAARIIEESGGGVVVRPQDSEGFARTVLDLLADDRRCAEMGSSGRAYAVREFDIGTIGDRFERILAA